MHTYFDNEVKEIAKNLHKRISSSNKGIERIVVAIAGPPASGKSTLAEEMVLHLNKEDAEIAALLPMDGFHLDNRILKERNLLPRKGAPQTFDAFGFCEMVARLKDAKADIVHPIFDRSLDIAIAGAGLIKSTSKVVIVEGNYLLLNTEPWRDLHGMFDETISINVSIEELEKRLIGRWLDNGLDPDDAKNRALTNDIPNAHYVLENSIQGKIIVDAGALD